MARTEYDVVIRGASNGIQMQIGCKTLVFADKDVREAMDDLCDYLTDKTGKEYEELYRKYFSGDNRGLGMAQPVYQDEIAREPVETTRAGRGLM